VEQQQVANALYLRSVADTLCRILRLTSVVVMLFQSFLLRSSSTAVDSNAFANYECNIS